MISKECCRSDTDSILFYPYLCAIDVFVGSLAYSSEIRGEVRIDFCNLRLRRRVVH
jgi:hypothetical protein